MAQVRPQDAELTVEQIADLLGRPPRTVRRQVARWLAQQWPRVRRATCRGYAGGRLMVDRDSFDAYCRGEAKPVPVGDDVAA